MAASAPAGPGRRVLPCRRPKNASLARRRPVAAVIGSGRDTLLVGDGILERLDQIGALPGERAVAAGLAAEMAIGRGLGVARLVEVEMPANARRRQVHDV